MDIVWEARSSREIVNIIFLNKRLGAGSKQYCRYTKSSRVMNYRVKGNLIVPTGQRKFDFGEV